MPTKRLSMKKLREILWLKLKAKLSMRAIQRVVKASLGAIQGIIKQSIALELTWEKVRDRIPGTVYLIQFSHRRLQFRCQGRNPTLSSSLRGRYSSMT
jgi:hypothetical protein